MAALSREMRQLVNAWEGSPQGWPKHLERLAIWGLRGWQGEQVDFPFPLMAIVGENGCGKSTVLQAIASVHGPANGDHPWYPSDFFPDSPWDRIEDVRIDYTVREGARTWQDSVRKGKERWRGYAQRPRRAVTYLDLRRMQPIVAQPGFLKLAKRDVKEIGSLAFDADRLARLTSVLGRAYSAARHSNTDANESRWVPVLGVGSMEYSGFHQGAGESVVADLLKVQAPRYSILLVDEVETSLHPRAQRRLVRDLAVLCRTERLQIVLTTHSPAVLSELPSQARLFIRGSADGKQILRGVSEEFALTLMDDEPHPEFDLFVEDDQARVWLTEILAAERRELLARSQIVAFGAAHVGRALGQMIDRFPRTTAVMLDADQEPAPGCALMPGGDAPERVVFDALEAAGWPDIADRLGRSHSDLVDSARNAMTLPDHHDWLRSVADRLRCSGGTGELWAAMCRAWVQHCRMPADTALLLAYLDERGVG